MESPLHWSIQIARKKKWKLAGSKHDPHIWQQNIVLQTGGEGHQPIN